MADMKKINQKTEKISSKQMTRMVIVFIFFLYITWIGAWLLERAIESHSTLLLTSMSRSIYWLVMKLILWILPAVIVIKLSKQKFSDVIGLYRFRSALIWGIGIGLILGIITIITKLLLSQPIFAFTLNWSLFSGLIVAPITEEITFRGAVLSLLKQRYSFALANFYTGILFLGIHLPGMIGYLYEIPNPILGR